MSLANSKGSPFSLPLSGATQSCLAILNRKVFAAGVKGHHPIHVVDSRGMNAVLHPGIYYLSFISTDPCSMRQGVLRDGISDLSTHSRGGKECGVCPLLSPVAWMMRRSSVRLMATDKEGRSALMLLIRGQGVTAANLRAFLKTLTEASRVDDVDPVRAVLAH